MSQQIESNTNTNTNTDTNTVFDRLTLSREESRVLNFVLNSEISNDLKHKILVSIRGPCNNCGQPSLYVLRNRCR